jgi:tRNA(Ile2) C34 agmatinyltransferase TiaS
MAAVTRSGPGGQMLEDIILAALAAGRVRQAGRRPACPVCGEAMWTFDREGASGELCCSGCGSRLSDAEDAADRDLRLIA